MKTMKLHFARLPKYNFHVLIDGEEVKLTKADGGREALIETERDEITVEVFNSLYLRSPLWLLFSAFLYIVSICGIFDFLRWRDCLFSYCHLAIPVQDGETVRLTRVSRKKATAPFAVESEIPLTVVDNMNYVDPVAKRRKWIGRILHAVTLLMAAGALFAILAIILLIVLL